MPSVYVPVVPSTEGLVEVQLYKELGHLRPRGVNILGEFRVLGLALSTSLQWKCLSDHSFPHMRTLDAVGHEASFWL